jgi:hypothetical protein
MKKGRPYSDDRRDGDGVPSEGEPHGLLDEAVFVAGRGRLASQRDMHAGTVARAPAQAEFLFIPAPTCPEAAAGAATTSQTATQAGATTSAAAL